MQIVSPRVNYYEYIESGQWAKKRREALDRAGGKCQLCGKTKRLNVHHNTYERLGHELPEDLVVLCKKCHDCFHAIRDKRTRKKARERTGIPSHVNRIPLLPPRPEPTIIPPPISNPTVASGTWKERKRIEKGVPLAEQVAQPPLVEIRIDAAYVESLMTPRGGVSALGVALLGEQWPPDAGWKTRAIGRVVRVNRLSLEQEQDRVRQIHQGDTRTKVCYQRMFTDEEVQAIRTDYVNGERNKRILAQRYGCGKSTIKRIVRDLVVQ